MVDLHQFLPGTGRGTTEEWWRGNRAHTEQPCDAQLPLRQSKGAATSPCRGGFR
jgi:hypothetical protein